MPSPKASGRSSLKVFNAHMDPIEAIRAAEHTGQAWTLSATRVSAAKFDVFLHDEIKKGGFLIGSAVDLGPLEARLAALEADSPDDYVVNSALNGTSFDITMNNGAVLSTDITTLLDNINAVAGVYVLDGAITSIPLTDGSSLEIDTSDLASDTELAAAIAALPPEEFVNSIVLSPAGVATFLTNQGTTAGTMDIAPVIENLESKLEQPVLAGTTVTFPLQGGTSYTLDLATLNETFTDNGDGSITIDDGEGGTFVLFTDTDDQVLISSDGSINIVPTTQPDGQIDYNARTSAAVIPATDPTGNGANRIQGVLNNLHSDLGGRVAAIEAQMPDDHVVGATVSGTNLTLQKSNGSNIVVSLGAFANAPDVQAVDGTYPFNAVSQNAAINMSDGGQIILDASVFATDNDLANAFAALPPEEHLETLNTVGNITTFVSNTGGTIGTLDLSAYANGADHFLQQPTIVGSTLTFPISNGVNYSLSLAALVANVDEDLTDNGDGTYTFTDGSGAQITFSGEPNTDDQNAAEVPITPIAGVTGVNVQEALESVASSMTQTISSSDGSITVNSVTNDIIARRQTTRTTVAAITANDEGIHSLVNPSKTTPVPIADLVADNAIAGERLQRVLASPSNGGMTNPDGSLGHYTKYVAGYGDGDNITPANWNGALHYISDGGGSDPASMNCTIDLPDYSGQMLTLLYVATKGGVDNKVTITVNNGNFYGDPVEIGKSNYVDTALPSITLWDGDSVQLIGSDSAGWWVVLRSARSLRWGTGYREYHDKTFDLWGTAIVPVSAANAFHPVDLPFAIDVPGSIPNPVLCVTLGNRNGNAGGSNPKDAVWKMNSSSQLAIAVPFEGLTTNVVISWHITGVTAL